MAGTLCFGQTKKLVFWPFGRENELRESPNREAVTKLNAPRTTLARQFDDARHRTWRDSWKKSRASNRFHAKIPTQIQEFGFGFCVDNFA